MSKEERKFPINEVLAEKLNEKSLFMWEIGVEKITSEYDQSSDTYKVRFPFGVAVSVDGEYLLSTKLVIPTVVPGPLGRMGSFGWARQWVKTALNQAQDAIVAESGAPHLKAIPFGVEHDDVEGIARIIDRDYRDIMGVDNEAGLDHVPKFPDVPAGK